MTQKARIAQIDDAIDYVAKRMTHVEDDAALATRIIASLPSRPTRFRWLVSSWTLRFALIALIVGGGVFLDRGAKTVSPIPASPIATAATLVASVKPAPIRTKPLEHPEPLERLEPWHAPLDHERSLPAIEAVTALTVEVLAPAAIPAEAPLVIEPLAIADLVLDPVQR